VKGAPILTDATMEDVRELGIEDRADEFLDTGGFWIGFNPELMGDALRSRLEEADIIILKGMANFESFSELDYRPVAYLLRSKCRPVSEALGVERDRNVAVLWE